MIDAFQLRTLALRTAALGEIDESRALERLDHLVVEHGVPTDTAADARVLVRASFVDILPCPCCGNSDLKVGSRGFARWGVACRYILPEGIGGCGLEVRREIDDHVESDDVEWLALRDAIRAWNRRTTLTEGGQPE